MKKKENGENYVEIKNANPKVLNVDNKVVKKKKVVLDKGIPEWKFEKNYIECNRKKGVYEKIAKAREEGKYVPSVGLSRDPNAWQKRDKDWEFENICDYEFGFTDEEKYCDLVKTDYVRFPMLLFVEDYKFTKRRYFSGDTILGAAINCIVKKPVSKYIFRNRDFSFDIHVLNQTFQTLYEKGIKLNSIYANYKTFYDSMLIYFGCSDLKDIQDFPKQYDINKDVKKMNYNLRAPNRLIKPIKYIDPEDLKCK